MTVEGFQLFCHIKKKKTFTSKLSDVKDIIGIQLSWKLTAIVYAHLTLNKGSALKENEN